MNDKDFVIAIKKMEINKTDKNVILKFWKKKKEEINNLNDRTIYIK